MTPDGDTEKRACPAASLLRCVLREGHLTDHDFTGVEQLRARVKELEERERWMVERHNALITYREAIEGLPEGTIPRWTAGTAPPAEATAPKPKCETPECVNPYVHATSECYGIVAPAPAPVPARTCDRCNGAGDVPDEDPAVGYVGHRAECAACEGTGFVPPLHPDPTGSAR